jgi:large subunit ribosomal protein L19
MQKSAIRVSPVSLKERRNLGIRSGDTVRVWQKIEEIKIGKAANKKATTTRNVRKQAFEGLVLAVKHGTEPGATFTVRRVASGVGVEKIFPLYSPNIDAIEILKRARVRRSKLYFIRRKAARDVKRQMRKARAYTAPEIAAETEEEVIVAPETVETTDTTVETPAPSEQEATPETPQEETAPIEAK